MLLTLPLTEYCGCVWRGISDALKEEKVSENNFGQQIRAEADDADGIQPGMMCVIGRENGDSGGKL